MKDKMQLSCHPRAKQQANLAVDEELSTFPLRLPLNEENFSSFIATRLLAVVCLFVCLRCVCRVSSSRRANPKFNSNFHLNDARHLGRQRHLGVLDHRHGGAAGQDRYR